MDYGQRCRRLNEYLARSTVVERKFTEEQLMYLRQYRQINKCPRIDDLRTAGAQLKNETFDFFLDIEEWFSNLRMIEITIEELRRQSKKAAA